MLSPIILSIVQRWCSSDRILADLKDDLAENKLFAPIIAHSVLSHPELMAKQLKWLAERGHSRRVHLVFTVGSIPLNNVVFPRGIWIGGIKFPLLPESTSNQVVVAAPAHQLKFPKYRLFALNGFDRKSIKREFKSVFDEFENQNFFRLSDQISFLAHKIWPRYFEFDVPPLILVCLEEVVREFLLRNREPIEDRQLPKNYFRIREKFKREEIADDGVIGIGLESLCSNVWPNSRFSEQIIKKFGVEFMQSEECAKNEFGAAHVILKIKREDFLLP